MTETIITVRGEAHATRHPEIAVVHIDVAVDSPESSGLIDSLSDRAAMLISAIRTAERDRLISQWSSDSVTSWTDTNWQPDGTPGQSVHRASQSFSLTFTMIDELAPWVRQVSDLPGVSWRSIQWALTEETDSDLSLRVSTEAINAARTRAHAYAEALGHTRVDAVEIADQGMMGSGSPAMMRSAMFDSADSPAIELRPEPVRISATIEGRFRAR